jgi:hypothetical protein
VVPRTFLTSGRKDDCLNCGKAIDFKSLRSSLPTEESVSPPLEVTTVDTAADELRLVCPLCRRRFSVTALAAGRLALCPSCGEKVPFPRPDADRRGRKGLRTALLCGRWALLIGFVAALGIVAYQVAQRSGNGPDKRSNGPDKRFGRFADKMAKVLPEECPDLKEGKDVQFSYDVRKTDSLVSPLTGVMEIRWTRESSDQVPPWRFLARCNYAFQDDHWVFKGAVVEITNPGDLPSDWQKPVKTVEESERWHFLRFHWETLASSTDF